VSGWSREFDLGETIYLNGATQGPLPRVAAAAVREALDWKRDPSVIDDAIYFALPDRVRRAAAPFFGCDPADIAVTTGASAGIGLLAGGLDWRPGDHVVIPAGEFPANYLPWQALRARGVELTVVSTEGGLGAERIAAALRPTTRVVAVGWVNFATGFRADVETIGELCAARGVAFLIDASQGLGAVPFDASACGAAIVTAAGYKWMCSPYGSGLFYVNPDWVERLPVPVLNWTSVVGAEDFNRLTDLEVAFRPGATRWDAPETASFFNCAPMAASLELLGGIGAGAIFAHTLALLDRFLEGLPRGFRTESSLEPGRRSPILRIVSDDPSRTREAYDRCRQAGICLGLREGGIRVSPGVWNTAADIDRLLERLAG
jgi:selenocysteine lyase/cysteine desulfurase